MAPVLGQISVTFGNLALATTGAAAVAIPVVIHLLTRSRRRPLPWAAMRFLTEAFRKQRRRLRLEQWLLLLVRCLLILALAAAVGQPVLAGLAKAWSLAPVRQLVCVVLDDSLSTQARDDADEQRFEALRRAALAIVAGLGPSDRLWVIRAAAPWEELGPPGSGSQAAMRQRIESLKPRYSRSALTEVLAAVGRKVSDPTVVAASERVLVVVLSDFSAATLDLDRPLPPALGQLSRRATLLLAPPAEAAQNVQIAQLRPRRRMIVAEGGTVLVPIELQLRRFTADRGASTTGIEVRLSGNDPTRPVAAAQREHQWAPGQNIATLNLELPFDAAGPEAEFASQSVAIEASIDTAGGADVLAADNHRLSVVQVRRRLNVAVADAADPANAEPYQPVDLLRFMLAPVQAVDEAPAAPPGAPGAVNPVSVLDVAVEQLDGPAIAAADAVIVLRPDLLTDRGTAALGALAERGGVIWLIAPAGNATATWGTPLCQRLGLDWQIDVELRTFEAPAADAEPVAPGSVQPGAAAFWTLALNPAPEALNRLSADWEALLRPIWVRRALSVAVAGNDSQVWLSTAQGLPVLLAHPRGAGMVLMLTTALDPDWTNLPVKKLFTPLFHDALRSVLGSGRADEAVCGRQVDLHRRWANVARLIHRRSGVAVALKHTDEGIYPAAALDRPGLYLSPAGVGGLKLAVNVDADGGDVRAVDHERLKASLGGQWLDRIDPAKALAAPGETTPLGWPLLWVVLALALLETVLARWFSHAGQPSAARWSGATGRSGA